MKSWLIWIWLPSLVFSLSAFAQSDTRAVRSTNCYSTTFQVLVTDPGKTNYVVASGYTISNIASLVISNVMTNVASSIPSTGLWGVDKNMALSPQPYALVLTSGLWRLNVDGTLAVSTNLWYDVFWVTNSLGDITPR